MVLLTILVILLGLSIPACDGKTPNCSTTLKPKSDEQSLIKPVLEKYEALLLMVIGFGGFSTIVAKLYMAMRKYVYRDTHNLDTAFDAGGRVTFSLTAVTVTSQMLWPADFLQSATVASKTGFGGSLWYSFAIVFNILVFPLLSVHLKTRAPGAKTFLQIVYARFGAPAHIVCCCAALLTNVITTTALILAGQTLLEVLAKDISNDLVVIVLALIFGSYCFIGGLGTTFYISYFNTALTLISVVVFVLNVSSVPEDDKDNYASMESMYEALLCLEGPEGNQDNSFMTFRSRSGIIFGIVFFFSASAFFVYDQASWQSRIAAKPTQGIIGFFLAAFLWFPIPASITMRSSMMYLSQSYRNGSHLLTIEEIDSGFITPYMMEKLMGPSGAYLLITMISMALMSTGSGEIMSMSSIIVYDIYRLYINPFRKNCASPTCCMLCGMEKVRDLSSTSKASDNAYCNCKSTDKCDDCLEDISMRNLSTKNYGITYICKIHGLYRHYEDLLIHYKSWCIVWVTAGIVPYGLVIVASGVNLNWAVFTLPVFIGPFVMSLVLTITWAKATGRGIIIGSLSGLAASLIGNLVVAAVVYEGGLNEFLINTSADYSLLVGIGSGLIVSSLMTILVSLFTTQVKTEEDKRMEWEKTLSIDNPVNPWRALYQEEFQDVSPDTRITSKMMETAFRKTTWMTYICGLCSTVFFLALVPGIMLSFEILTYDEFKKYMSLYKIWGIIAAAFAVLAPPVEEIIQISRHKKLNKI